MLFIRHIHCIGKIMAFYDLRSLAKSRNGDKQCEEQERGSLHVLILAQMLKRVTRNA